MTLEGDFTRDAPVPGTPEPGGLPGEMGVFETATGKRVPKPRETRIQAAQAGSATANADPWPPQSGVTGGPVPSAEERSARDLPVDDGKQPNRMLAAELGLPIAEEQREEDRVEGEQAVSLTHGPGTWKRLRPGDALTLMLERTTLPPPHLGVDVAAPQREPVRIDYGRTKAHTLGLPFTPDMKLDDAVPGTRAVDAMGRVGTFTAHVEKADFAQGGDRVKVLFVADPVTPEEARERVETAMARLQDHAMGAQAPFGNARNNPTYYYAPTTWTRNGRETGAWIAGLATRQQHCRVRLLTDHVDGAVTSLVAAGMLVGRHSGPTTEVEMMRDGGPDVAAEAHSYSVLDVECPPHLAGTF